jgi:peptide/nickel transport system permease protein
MAISRVIDLLLAFPILLLALGLGAACSLGGGCFGGLLKPGLVVVIFVIAFVNWTYIARIVRGQVLSLREKEFVEAARSLGASNTRIIFKRSCRTWSRRSSSTRR